MMLNLVFIIEISDMQLAFEIYINTCDVEGWQRLFQYKEIATAGLCWYSAFSALLFKVTNMYKILFVAIKDNI